MPKIIELGERSADSRHWGVEATLQSALEEVRSGERKGSKVLVLFLDDGEQHYNFGFRLGV